MQFHIDVSCFGGAVLRPAIIMRSPHHNLRWFLAMTYFFIPESTNT